MEGGIVKIAISLPVTSVKYFVEVIKEGDLIQTTKPSHIRVLTNSELKRMENELEEVIFDDFLTGMIYSQYGLLEPALAHYEKYFAEHRDDEDLNELRPFILEVYTRLHLDDLKGNALEQYKLLASKKNKI